MNFKYPNGKVYKPKVEHTWNRPKQVQYSNRGMTLEEDLNETNQYYRDKGIAVIHKKPTPVQIVSVDYPKRSAAVIKEAYFKQASTTDYNGVYNGKYIDFEAKETRSTTSFPLQNIHEHQVKHMEAVLKQNGICFLIIRFANANEIYFLEAEKLLHFWARKQNGGRKSISKAEIETYGYKIPLGYQPRIDYIKVIEHLYF
ncbi:Holliday junction resolvase RecU [Bacillus alveayuensis]|uniref:Holliday junction resolvase RecU n=1 Tax=Aeribacillus alveayuensis TaxID=279215 RepID=A0ABT9VKS5_9BACI|nr:Holliday junction resolvase RecU [Bacillus alveayuensis]MDQ0161576.1 recombination protein U [Bacillus alveayuensis]